MRAWPRGIWIEAISWILFPLVPVLLEQYFYGLFNWSNEDPRDWTTDSWIILLGPLVGYGFLAGATVVLAHVPVKSGVRGWLSRAALWVGVGPWLGLVLLLALGFVLGKVLGSEGKSLPIWFIALVSSYGWLIVAFAALRRARRAGRLWDAVQHGVATSLAFVGSLFGSFWAVTEAWRSYFFDPTLVRSVILALCLATLSGCGTLTVGEERRRDLFGAMLTAWVLGLALIWRWWARSRSKPPAP
jgi:hypothetical protein